MDLTYLLILMGILVLSPIILAYAVKQEKKFKEKVRKFCLFLLGIELLLGFLGWESFSGGRSGFSLALEYPSSFLWAFFVITIVQIFLLIFNKEYFGTIATVLNFLNTIALFTGLIRVSNALNYQIVSYASILVIFLVLILNVALLVYINKDKELLKKYPY